MTTTFDSLHEDLSRVDTIFIDRIDPEIQLQYFEILASTNTQMSIWLTALGTFISAIGVLFTIAAIVAGWFIWRQGEEFKKRQDNLFANFTSRMSNQEEEAKIIVEKLTEMVALKEEEARKKPEDSQIKEDINTLTSASRQILGQPGIPIPRYLFCKTCLGIRPHIVTFTQPGNPSRSRSTSVNMICRCEECGTHNQIDQVN
jgi:RNase P subunit RPR2